jgi:hypothetical protein
MEGYNKDFRNYESFTESQHKAVTFINYCKIINAMGIYEFDIGEPDDSGTLSATYVSLPDFTAASCVYVYMSLYIAMY